MARKPKAKLSSRSVEHRIKAIVGRKDLRNAARVTAGKKPLIRPLRTTSKAKLKEAIKAGKFVVECNGRTETVILKNPHGLLQGVFTGKQGSLYDLRYDRRSKQLECFKQVIFEGIIQPVNVGYCSIEKKGTLHLLVDKKQRIQSIGEKLLSRTVKQFYLDNPFIKKILFSNKSFKPLLEKMGFIVTGKGKEFSAISSKAFRVSKKSDMNGWHSIEALDPKNGRIRLYRIPVKPVK